MKILLAVPDRDLLSSLEIYLSLCGNEVVSAFDGIQAASAAANGGFDIALVDPELSRTTFGEMSRLFGETKTPVIALTKTRLPAGNATSASCLAYPFTPSELTERINEVVKKTVKKTENNRMVTDNE